MPQRRKSGVDGLPETGLFIVGSPTTGRPWPTSQSEHRTPDGLGMFGMIADRTTGAAVCVVATSAVSTGTENLLLPQLAIKMTEATNEMRCRRLQSSCRRVAREATCGSKRFITIEMNSGCP